MLNLIVIEKYYIEREVRLWGLFYTRERVI